MSQPISQCAIIEAAKDERAYQRLLRAMKYNKASGHFTVWPCECHPPCTKPSQAEQDWLTARLEKDLEGIECTGGGLQGAQGPVGVE